MTIPPDLVKCLKFLHPKDILSRMKTEDRPRFGVRMCLTNEIKPADLFCYLAARFGIPNGIQNLLRSDDSDNLIHWEWTLSAGDGLFNIQGMNFRTEIWLLGFKEAGENDMGELVTQIRNDFANYGPEMSKVRKSLEHWIEFVNPYQRLRRAVYKLWDEVKSLKLDPEEDAPKDFWEKDDPRICEKAWKDATARYTEGLGLCFGIRAMLPVMAESFVNVIMYLLLRPEIRSDERLRENSFRQPIDIRIKSLSLNCVGFKKAVDYSHEACKAYHSIVNERNDMLHGNISPAKVKFNDLYFWGKVPVFKEYHSMWERSIGIEQRAVGLSELQNEVEVVESFIEYILSCVDENLRPRLEMILEKYDLGLDTKTGGIGILFPDWVVDFKPVFRNPDENGGE